MTTAVSAEVLAPGQRTLGELADTANREHRAAQAAATTMLEHAINTGEALLAARQVCPSNEWERWLRDKVDFSTGAARQYMRIAHLKHVLAQCEEPVASITQAKRLLAGLPATNAGGNSPLPSQTRDAIKDLVGRGFSQHEIARQLGVARTSIRRVIDPDGEKARADASRKRREDRRRAEARLKRASAVKQALVKEGEAFNEAYTLLGRLEQLLGRSREEAREREKKLAIGEIQALRNKLADMVVAYLGVE